MALAFINTTSDNSSGASSLTASVPTNTADNDILVALLVVASNPGTITVPSGWTLGASDAGNDYSYIYWKIASSEAGSYTWSWSSSLRSRVQVGTWRGVKTSDPIAQISNTAYTTDNTTLRAGSVTASDTGQDILFFGYSLSNNVTVTYTPPSSPASFTEDIDVWETASDAGIHAARLNWSGSGATGNIDAAATRSTTVKHAYAILFNLPITEDTPPAAQVNLGLQVVLESLATVDNPPVIELTPSLIKPLGEVTASTFTGRVRGFRLFENHALEQRDHNNYES